MTLPGSIISGQKPTEVSIVLGENTINWVYENIHVLNVYVNEFSRVPRENILAQKMLSSI